MARRKLEDPVRVTPFPTGQALISPACNAMRKHCGQGKLTKQGKKSISVTIPIEIVRALKCLPAEAESEGGAREAESCR